MTRQIFTIARVVIVWADGTVKPLVMSAHRERPISVQYEGDWVVIHDSMGKIHSYPSSKIHEVEIEQF